MLPTVDPTYRAMRRVGAAAPRAEFTAALAEALRSTLSVSDEEIRRRFVATRAYGDFCALLGETAPPARAWVLAIGTGDGMGGRKAGYAASVVREQCADPMVQELNWGDEAPPDLGTGFDLVVTHSFLHYFQDFSPVCEWIEEVLNPGGWYVMANEPNVRFWRNAECVRAMERVGEAESRRRRLLKFVNPFSYLSKAARVLKPRKQGDPFAEASRLVRERMGLQADLTPGEIVAILEPHRGGLDVDDLETGALEGMRLEAVRTSGYLHRDNPVHVPARWRSLDEDLAARYPLDGCTLSALWRKP